MKASAWRSMLLLFPVCALAGEHGEHGGHGERREHETLPAAASPAYRATCGGCHLAYPPGLLPARSWLKIVNDPGGHPGGDLGLGAKTRAELAAYLARNGADRSGAKRSRKILASIGAGAPTRISDVPYIREKHRELRDEVFARRSVGSRGNCVACHAAAERGDFDDDEVTVPR